MIAGCFRSITLSVVEDNVLLLLWSTRVGNYLLALHTLLVRILDYFQIYLTVV